MTVVELWKARLGGGGAGGGAAGGGAAAAGIGAVDDVVVDEGGGVQELDRGGERHQQVEVVFPEAAGEEGESGAEELAAAARDQPQHLPQRGVVHLLERLEGGLNEG